MTEDRRIADAAAHKEILDKLRDISESQLTLDKGQIAIKLTQDGVIKRLDKINGTVADYNIKKYKIDEAHMKVQNLEATTIKSSQLLAETALINKNISLQKDLEHEQAHSKICEDIKKSYVSNETLRTVLNTIKFIGVIFSLILSFLAIMTVLKSCGIDFIGL